MAGDFDMEKDYFGGPSNLGGVGGGFVGGDLLEGQMLGHGGIFADAVIPISNVLAMASFKLPSGMPV